MRLPARRAVASLLIRTGRGWPRHPAPSCTLPMFACNYRVPMPGICRKAGILRTRPIASNGVYAIVVGWRWVTDRPRAKSLVGGGNDMDKLNGWMPPEL